MAVTNSYPEADLSGAGKVMAAKLISSPCRCSSNPCPMRNLPIDRILPLFKETLQDYPSVIIHAPPGAGKTTRIPLALLDPLNPQQKKIVMLEPRRLAAVNAARWMAVSLGRKRGKPWVTPSVLSGRSRLRPESKCSPKGFSPAVSRATRFLRMWGGRDLRRIP